MVLIAQHVSYEVRYMTEEGMVALSEKAQRESE